MRNTCDGINTNHSYDFKMEKNIYYFSFILYQWRLSVMCIETIENSELDFHTNVSTLLVNVLN
jgi:hypothetical protein